MLPGTDACISRFRSGNTPWLLVCLAAMRVTFMAGLGFTRLPNTHLDEFHDALTHDEILQMIGTTAPQVPQFEDRNHHHHPQSVVGGVDWGTEAFGL